MEPTYPTEGTQARRILDALLEAKGVWISKQHFIRSMFLTQAGARIFELENDYHWPIEHSKDTDEHGFKSYRILQETSQLTLTMYGGGK
jgi:hypothetical protein